MIGNSAHLVNKNMGNFIHLAHMHDGKLDASNPNA